MKTDYIKVFGGNSLEANRVKSSLQEIGIEPVVKNENESARLAGFGTSLSAIIELFVHKDEEKKALLAISTINWKK